MRQKLLDMMEQLINGKYDCNAFSYDFPTTLFGASEELMNVLDNAPEICSMYDPYKTDENDLFNEVEFKTEIKKLFDKLKAFQD